MKKINSKENSGDTDMLSAFTDKPQPEPSPKTKSEEPVKLPDDATWEEKETVIEKESVYSINPEIEEREIQPPKTTETLILPPDEDKTDDEKLQYDRDFLLKFQFAPICTRKPEDLPNMEIILDKAHAGTKALDQGSRINSNDFMPTFMRSQSGGGHGSGSRRNDSRDGRDRRGGDRGGGRNIPNQPQPKKIIHVPNLTVNAEFGNKAENAWVRPSDLAKQLDESEREMDEVRRSVRAVLNKLTPQKFKTLTNQIIELKIDTQVKLEATIDLIFEKAVSEPVFSVAYANMCRVLAEQYKNVPSSDENGKSSTTTFRKILLNKCQKEFEKEKESDKAIEDDKLKNFDTEEEKTNWLKEIDYREQQLRRRTRGNIRFIGELFKLKMISETIMHECVFKLLRSEGASQEDSLECLCGLLTTIGELLDHKKAKPRMDQYFTQMEKIIAQAGAKKISSRIKFALRDVIDLRQSGWKARRETAGPKTIDQIHKEAAAAERESQLKDQMIRMQGPPAGQQQRANQNRGGMDRGAQPRGQSGRDNPNARGGGAATDAWQSVPSKGARNISQTPIDAGRFKLNRSKDSETISLGPGGMRPSAWAMGASGGSSRPGSGGNTPTSELDKKNRYDVLQDTSISSIPDTRRGSRGSQGGTRGSNRGTPTNGSSTPTSARRAVGPDERTAALRAAKEIVAGQRVQSPAAPAPSSRMVSDSSITTPVNVEISKDMVKRKTIATISELLSSGTEKEAQQCILDLKCPQMHHIVVEESINHVLEKKPQDRRKVGNFLTYVSKNGVIDVTQLVTGFAAVAEFATDIAVDVPFVYKYLGEILAPIVSDGVLPLNKVKDTLECLIKLNKAGIVMAETLSECVKITQSEDSIASMWQSSGLTWKSLLKEGYPVEEFISDKKMEFTGKTCTPNSQTSHVQQELIELLKNKRDNNAIFSFFEGKVPKATQSTPEFIQDLSYTICKSTIIVSAGGCSCDDKQLESRCNLLLKFIDRNKTLELHCLFSLQKLANDYDHPKDLLRSMCHVLYSNKVLTEDTFYTWESSKDFPEGKGVAASSLKSYLSWLREAEEESNDDEIPVVQS